MIPETTGKIFSGRTIARAAIVDGSMNSALYHKILKEIVWTWIRLLKVKQSWVMEQDNYPKRTSKSTYE